MDTTVAVSPLVTFVLPILLTIISAMIAIAVPIIVTKLNAKFGLQIDAQKRDALQAAFTNSAGALLQKYGEEAKKLTVNVGNPDLAAEVNRILKSTPDALAWAGLSQQEIAKRILATIPQVSSTV